MSVLHFEQWDGVTAPAIPSGWNVQTGISTTSTGPTPISSPNMVQVISSSTGFLTATWGTVDGVSGNVTVQGTGCDGTLAGATTGYFSVFARGSASTLLYASSTFYEAQLSFVNGTLKLNSVVAGSSSTLNTVSTAALTGNQWYQMALTCNVNAIGVSVQRVSDGFWLTSAGSFQALPATAIALSDATVTGSGYAGWAANSVASTSKIFGDDWTLSSLTAPAVPPNPPVIVRIPFAYYPHLSE
jgi:hypothetical protein